MAISDPSFMQCPHDSFFGRSGAAELIMGIWLADICLPDHICNPNLAEVGGVGSNPSPAPSLNADHIQPELLPEILRHYEVHK